MSERAGGEIRVGIGGWTFAPWRGTFYPEGLAQKRELSYASRKLTTIEINGTYYGSQKPESFARWREETPDDFVFAVKGPRFTTNRRLLAEAGASIERFFSSGVMELKEKLGPVNWQFLPGKKLDLADFEAFLRLLPRTVEGRAVRHAVEVRHESFETPDFVALLRSHAVAIVTVADCEHPQIADVTASFVYARIMGTLPDQEHGYGPDALDRWSEHIRTWAAGGRPLALRTLAPPAGGEGGRDVWLYVIGGHKLHNPAAAMALIERLGR